MKIRKIVDGKVKWFGTYPKGSTRKYYESPMLEIKTLDDYVEAYKYRIYNLLSIIRRELPDKTYGIEGVFYKKTKEEIDVEIQEALRNKLNLIVNKYASVVQDSGYRCVFTVTTPKGNSISLDISL